MYVGLFTLFCSFDCDCQIMSCKRLHQYLFNRPQCPPSRFFWIVSIVRHARKSANHSLVCIPPNSLFLAGYNLSSACAFLNFMQSGEGGHSSLQPTIKKLHAAYTCTIGYPHVSSHFPLLNAMNLIRPFPVYPRSIWRIMKCRPDKR